MEETEEVGEIYGSKAPPKEHTRTPPRLRSSADETAKDELKFGQHPRPFQRTKAFDNIVESSTKGHNHALPT